MSTLFGQTPTSASPRAAPAEALLILVDETDAEVGHAEKLEAHRLGALHRAVSVSIADSKGNILIQRRASGKYHSAGLWSNACCSHPLPGEEALAAAQRRLGEEMGFVCDLGFRQKLRYSSEVGAGLIENELVHFFAGTYDGEVIPEPSEVGEIAWVPHAELYARVRANPVDFSAWFRIYVEAGVI
ncbi:isopentenyl-diphosphate Delta-isomerase [Novosphingobium sp. Gsoil 351]|uniref:isopentenyl-diphosphate Delta-isomerase n=1 Tax=Novosphingobium sp. Gsoil 351 TaxID=2675225 RepID=UPI0012B4CF66|nr:isopentenyl-diphosphate Delta-isomerase [Novosphingobium sp. Gsoil 351]QGN54574.1 isopentenyl-diphosphate Delta-isomerase [Novosphingobium sp. Gsoil 351]